MAAIYDMRDLEGWDRKIRAKADDIGLNCFPQEFEICDHTQMMGYMAYSGMPAHYPHWSYGKAYERQKTLYDHGVAGLPYEMVINSDPCLAYLMRDNSLCLQILTIAHVYGHNDFFRNNFSFDHLRAELTIDTFKTHADRMRDYVETPSVGIDRVEALLDAAQALSFQCRRNAAVRKPTPAQQEERVLEAAAAPSDPYHRIHKRAETEEPDLHRLPLEPDEDVLLFIRDHNPRLAEWQRDALTIVHDEARYFLPQMETKIINEGWASYWHHKIMNALDLPEAVRLEFLVRHNQVVAPHAGGINPYYLGFKLWEDIARRGGDIPLDEFEPTAMPAADVRDEMLAVREVDRDVSFLRRFLTEDMMRSLGLFEYQQKGDDYVVTKVADDDGWRAVKDTLLRNVGTGSIPVIKVVDADHGGSRGLQLRHQHDGRDLQLGYAEKTLQHLHSLWGRQVILETSIGGKPQTLTFNEDGFATAA